MTISHVIYLEFARLIVSWKWVTEVLIPCCPCSCRACSAPTPSHHIQASKVKGYVLEGTWYDESPCHLFTALGKILTN